MSDVQVIKANRNENRIRGRKVEILRVAAYLRRNMNVHWLIFTPMKL